MSAHRTRSQAPPIQLTSQRRSVPTPALPSSVKFEIIVAATVLSTVGVVTLVLGVAWGGFLFVPVGGAAFVCALSLLSFAIGRTSVAITLGIGVPAVVLAILARL